MEIIFDIDGFCSLANSTEKNKLLAEGKSCQEDKLIIVDPEPQSIDNLVEQYYLGLRSAMFICEDTVNDGNEAKEALQRWRKTCLKEAWAYVHHHIAFGKVLLPDFMWDTKSAIINELKDKYPDVVNIQLRFSMKPKLSAKVIDKDIITFPVLSRAMLNHYNLVLINTIYDITNENGEVKENEEGALIDSEYIKRNIARLMLPYLLFCHDDISVANLPIIGVYSKDVIKQVTILTKLQLIFIIAHEYAHIVLKHFENTVINLETKIRIENEADNLALKVVLGYIEKDNTYSKIDVYTAIRWLYKYQLLEEWVGCLVREEKIQPYGSMFEERRGKLQFDLFKNYALRGSSMLEIMGFYMIVNFQSILYNFKPKLINYIIDKLRETRKTGVVEPWWEKITTT
jgi:hypothetical protein